MAFVIDHFDIPAEELEFSYSRSSGPGGQHVNKVSSRVTLWFHLDASPSLTGEQKARLRQRLSSRINRQGRLWLGARASRSQHANRESAIRHFYELLSWALTEEPPRLPTRVPKSSRVQRLTAKRHRAQIKSRGRGKVSSEE